MKPVVLFFIVLALAFQGCRYSTPILSGKKRIKYSYAGYLEIDSLGNQRLREDSTHIMRISIRYKYFSFSTISLTSGYSMRKEFNEEGLLESTRIMKTTPAGVHDPGTHRREKFRVKRILYNDQGKKTSVELLFRTCINFQYIIHEKIIHFDSTGQKTVERKPKQYYSR